MPQTDKLHDARPPQVGALGRRGRAAGRLRGHGRGGKQPVSLWAGLGALVAFALLVNGSLGLAALEHVVQPGDTLSALASRYGVTVEELAEVNRITNPNLIFVGDTLRIPDSGEGDTGTAGTTATSVPPMPPVISVPPPPSADAPVNAPTVPMNAPTVTPPPPPPIPGSPAADGPATTQAPPTTVAPPSTTAPPPPTTQPVAAVSPNPPTTEPPAPPTTAPPTTQPPAPQPPAPTPTSSPPPAPDPQDADGDGEDDNAELPEGAESAVEWSPYTIRSGDWLSSIADRYDTTVEELARVNTLTNTNLIYVGQVILVPTSRTESTPTDASPSPTAGMTVEQRLDHWANHYNVPPEMLKALTWWESGWNNNAISSAGAIGIGQLLPTTADFVADVLIGEELNPYAVDDNIRMTARFVRYLLDETGNDRRLTLASYYQGLFAVRKYGVYKISIPYVNGILALQDRFR